MCALTVRALAVARVAPGESVIVCLEPQSRVASLGARLQRDVHCQDQTTARPGGTHRPSRRYRDFKFLIILIDIIHLSLVLGHPAD